MTKKLHSYSLVALAILASNVQVANAAGFKIFEQSTSAMGNAYAGRGAQITDASIGFTN
ncbi:MAG: transporter, partial [Psychrobium sp.]|nr:transporter [Psychrobium sp.]